MLISSFPGRSWRRETENRSRLEGSTERTCLHPCAKNAALTKLSSPTGIVKSTPCCTAVVVTGQATTDMIHTTTSTTTPTPTVVEYDERFVSRLPCSLVGSSRLSCTCIACLVFLFYDAIDHHAPLSLHDYFSAACQVGSEIMFASRCGRASQGHS